MKNLLFFLGAISLTFTVIFITVNKKSTLENDSSTIIVGTNASFPPFQYLNNGQLEGFDIDLMNLIGKKLEKKIVFKDMSFDSLLIEAQRGSIHVIAAGMTPTEERAKKVFFTKPYVANDSLIVVTKAQDVVHHINDLNDKEVIVNEGYSAESYMLKQNIGILKRLETPAEAFLALTTNRGYAYVTARSAAQPFFKKHGMHNFNIFTLPLKESAALATSKNYPKLAELMQEALDVLEKNGELKKLKQMWHLDF